MSEIDPKLKRLMQPYFGAGQKVRPDAKLVEDLEITGHDYFDLIADIESAFDMDMTRFFVGPEPQYVSTGWLGWIVGEPKKPVFRDVSIREIDEFLRSLNRR